MPFDDCTLKTYRGREFRLSHGAHGKRQDGVCVLEAALEWAGLPHQRVTGAMEMPPEFSIVLCEYALCLNDALPDDLRTPLLAPYARRLCGTGSDRTLEHQRWKFIRSTVFRRIVSGKPREPIGFLELVCEIAACPNPRKWELGVEVLGEALAIGTHDGDTTNQS